MTSANFCTGAIGRGFAFSTASGLSFCTHNKCCSGGAHHPCRTCSCGVLRRAFGCNVNTRCVVGGKGCVATSYCTSRFSSSCYFFGSGGACGKGTNRRRIHGQAHGRGLDVGNVFGLNGQRGLSINARCVISILGDRASGVTGRSTCALTLFTRSRVGLLEGLRTLVNMHCVCRRGFGGRTAPGMTLVCGPNGFGFHTSCTTNFQAPALSRLCTASVTGGGSELAVNGLSLGPRGGGCFSLDTRCMRRHFSMSIGTFCGGVHSVVSCGAVTAKSGTVRRCNRGRIHRHSGVTRTGIRKVGMSTGTCLNTKFGLDKKCARLGARSIRLRRPVSGDVGGTCGVGTR